MKMKCKSCGSIVEPKKAWRETLKGWKRRVNEEDKVWECPECGDEDCFEEVVEEDEE